MDNNPRPNQRPRVPGDLEAAMRHQNLVATFGFLDDMNDGLDDRNNLLRCLGVSCGESFMMGVMQHGRVQELMRSGIGMFDWKYHIEGPFESGAFLKLYSKEAGVRELDLNMCFQDQPLRKVELACDAIAGSKVKKCDLSRNYFSSDALKVVLAKLDGIQRVILWNSVNSGECAQTLIDWVESDHGRKIKEIDLGVIDDWSEQLVERFVDAVAKQDAVCGFGMVYAKVSERVVDKVCQMILLDRLTFIGLYYCRIGEDGMARLMDLIGKSKKLKDVRLQQRDSTVEQMADLIGACGVRVENAEMNLWNWNDDQRAIVAAALRSNYSITCGIDDGDDEIDSLLERNRRCIENCRTASLMIGWIATVDRADRGWFHDGEYRVIPKDTIGDIARLVWSTAGCKEWYFGD